MNKEYGLLVTRCLEGEATREEMLRFEQMAASPGLHAEISAYREVRRLVHEHGAGSFSPYFSDRLMKELVRSKNALERDAGWSWSGMLRPALIAAIPILLLLAGALVFLMRPVTITVPNGEMRQLALADGSRVELAAGSRLEHSRFLTGRERAVTLRGEAFFDVVPDGRPFTVNTFNAEVNVLGTSFNVRAWPDDAEQVTEVALRTGLVEVVSKGSESVPVVLQPGEITIVAADTTAPRPASRASLERALAWRSGGLAFSDAPLGSVANELERRYNVQIDVAEERLRQRRVTFLEPSPASLSQVLDDISQVLNLEYRRTARGYMLASR